MKIGSNHFTQTGKASLNVYDLKGAVVGMLLNENKVAGAHQ